jgi:hypothetical protein
MVTLEQMVK